MKVRTAILWLALLLGFCACSDKKGLTDTLHRAEALMNEYPDSALQLLRALPVADMHQAGNRARYALLYSRALDKNYIDETNDSLINIAVDYYRTTDDVRSKFLAFYYQGRVYTNAGESVKAMMAYTEAEQLADEVKDGYLLGLLYTQIGNIYRNNFDSSKSLAAYKHAEANYAQAGKELHRLYAMLGQASIYRDMNNLEESYQLLKRVKAEVEAINNRQLHSFCLSDLMMLCVEMERIHEAQDLYKELTSQYTTDNKTAVFMSSVARLYATVGDKANALTALSQAWSRVETQSDSIILHCDAAKVYELLHNPKEAYRNLELGVLMQNRIVRETLQQPIITVQRNYLADKLELEANQLRLEKRYKVLSILFLLMLLVVTVYAFIRIFKRYKKNSLQTIRFLENEKTKAEVRIASLLKQLDKDKKEADITIAKLKEEILRNEENSHAEIARLLQHLEQSRGGMTDSLEHLRSELDALQDDNQKQSSQKLELLKNYLEQVVELVLLHSENWHNDNYRIKRVNENVALLKLHYFAGEKEYKQVEKLVNLYLDNVMVHFRKEVSLVSESDYRRVCYMFAGVSAPYIAQIMDESKEVVYQRRSRLLKKLASLPCCHKEMFMLLLSK